MPSILRLSAATALVSTAAASGIGAIASQTIAGFGAPLFAEPTKAPEYELVKAKLAKKAVTNVCSEWTIPGGRLPSRFEAVFHAGTDGYTQDSANLNVPTRKHVCSQVQAIIGMKDVGRRV